MAAVMRRASIPAMDMGSGIRERVAARGGSLSIAKAARGLRLSAVIPLMAPGPAPAFHGAPA